MIMFENVVVVCGGRNYRDVWPLTRVLDELEPTLIINGGATGADGLSSNYAQKNGIPYLIMPALWEAEGKGAGPTRNRRMALLTDVLSPASLTDKPTLVACPGGRGTASMKKIAQSLDWTVVETDEE